MYSIGFTDEMIDYLRKEYPLRIVTDILPLFNTRFGTDFTKDQLLHCIKNKNIKSGRDTRFPKGNVPWCQGRKGYMGANRTSFKKGNIPHNTAQLWDERIDKDGYIRINVPERNPHTGFPSHFKHKHVWLWEQANGPIPKGSCVIFKDGNKLNCILENLMLVTRRELLSLNLHKYSEQPAELQPSILALAKLDAAAGIRTRGRVAGAGRKKGTSNKRRSA